MGGEKGDRGRKYGTDAEKEIADYVFMKDYQTRKATDEGRKEKEGERVERKKRKKW